MCILNKILDNLKFIFNYLHILKTYKPSLQIFIKKIFFKQKLIVFFNMHIFFLIFIIKHFI